MQYSSNSSSSSVNLFVQLYQVMVYSNALNNHKVYEKHTCKKGMCNAFLIIVSYGRLGKHIML